MTASALADNREKLFGRSADLRYLRTRAHCKGLTAITGRPQMGKSWLIEELARQLACESKTPYLVGLVRSCDQGSDRLLRAVQDLYERRLSDATLLQDFRIILDQQKENVLPGLLSSLGRIFKDTISDVAKPLGSVVEEAMNGLAATAKSLSDGRLALPPLQYDQARDLVALLARVTKKPIALFLDHWEKSQDPKLETNILDTFLHNLDEWPQCHIFIALAPGTNAAADAAINRLVQSLRGAAELYELQEMDLRDEPERSRVLGYVRSIVPPAREMQDERILNMIGGHPGVLYRWTNTNQLPHVPSVERMAALAADARAYRFPEIDGLMKRIEKDHLRLAARLTVLPSEDPYIWSDLKTAVLDGLNEDFLDDLRLAGVLELADPPSFGHDKRWEAVQHWLTSNRKPVVRREAEALVEAIAPGVRKADFGSLSRSLALRTILARCSEVAISPAAIALCQAAASIVDEATVLNDTIVDFASSIDLRPPRLFILGPVLAMGLVNGLHYAKRIGDLALRDRMLTGHRTLFDRYMQAGRDGGKQLEELSKIVERTNSEPDRKIREEALRLLRPVVHEAFIMRGFMAMNLVNAMVQAKEEGDLQRRDNYLSQVHNIFELVKSNSEVRAQFARGLQLAIRQAREERDAATRDRLLSILRQIAEPPESKTVAPSWLTRPVAEGRTDRERALSIAAETARYRYVRMTFAEALIGAIADAKRESRKSDETRLRRDFRQFVVEHESEMRGTGIVKALRDATASLRPSD